MVVWPVLLLRSGYGDYTSQGELHSPYFSRYEFTAVVAKRFIVFGFRVQGCFGILGSLILELLGRTWSHSGMADLHIDSHVWAGVGDLIPIGIGV